jgi:hypothetical protein
MLSYKHDRHCQKDNICRTCLQHKVATNAVDMPLNMPSPAMSYSAYRLPTSPTVLRRRKLPPAQSSLPMLAMLSLLRSPARRMQSQLTVHLYGQANALDVAESASSQIWIREQPQ